MAQFFGPPCNIGYRLGPTYKKPSHGRQSKRWTDSVKEDPQRTVSKTGSNGRNNSSAQLHPQHTEQTDRLKIKYTAQLRLRSLFRHKKYEQTLSDNYAYQKLRSG